MDWLKRRLGIDADDTPRDPEPASPPADTPYVPRPLDEAPLPGVRLLRRIADHTQKISAINWSPDGKWLASSSYDNTVRIRNGGSMMAELPVSKPFNLGWAPQEPLLAVSGIRGIEVWNIKQQRMIRRTGDKGFGRPMWSPDGQRIAFFDSLRGDIYLWSLVEGYLIRFMQLNKSITELIWSIDGESILCTGNKSFFDDKSPNIEIFQINIARKTVQSIIISDVIDAGRAYEIHYLPYSRRVATCMSDGTIRICDLESLKVVKTVEAHADRALSISFSADGRLLASYSHDKTLKLWRCDTLSQVGSISLETDYSENLLAGVRFHPHLPILATRGSGPAGVETEIHLWEIDIDALLAAQRAAPSVHYTTAKIVLVGDAGVGKTGLGWRIAHGEFKEHASTHGQQFWVADELSTTRADGTQCEAVLWDLAGQHVYRPIHSIFLDDVDVSLVLFDPTNRHEPLKGAEFWLQQLAGKEELPPSVLVGARVDRGASAISQAELVRFCQRHRVSGGYIPTSARTGEGLDVLLDTIKRQIPWDRMTTTVTTLTFKRIKDYVLQLKAHPARSGVLVTPAELRRQLEAGNDSWEFSDAELLTAVKHLETHGYVTILRSTAGEQFVLLVPELLATLAASVVLQADKHPRELGALSETTLLQVGYPFAELATLDASERQILLDAAASRFLKHNVCFRETLGSDTLLIFPGLIKQKRPLLDEVEAVEDASYIARGAVENVYAALVVLLGYTQTFTRINHWQNQAQYELGRNQVAGFRLVEDREGEIELVLYYSPTMPEYGRTQFQGLFEQFLYQRDVQVTRFPPVRCPCGHRQERAIVVKRIREGKDFLFCEECGERTALPEIEQPFALHSLAPGWVRREEALARLRAAYETYLTNIKGYRRDRTAPRCYVSAVSTEQQWAAQLTRDLRDAGVHVLDQAAHVQPQDVVLMLNSTAYQRAWQRKDGALASDQPLIRARLGQKEARTLIPLTVEPEAPAAKLGDFRDQSRYTVSLFDLVLELYAIPFSNPAFAPLRRALHDQWQQTVAPYAREAEGSKPLDLPRVRQSLTKRLSPNDVAALCFDLGLDEQIGDGSHETRVRELLALVERRGMLPKLLRRIAELRPDLADQLGAGPGR